MNIVEHNVSRFGEWLIKNKLDEHVYSVIEQIEAGFLFTNNDDPDSIQSRKAGSLRRSVLKYMSRVKLREAVLDYVKNDFNLRTLTRDDIQAIMQRSVRSKYAYALRFEKSMHKQGLYVS